MYWLELQTERFLLYIHVYLIIKTRGASPDSSLYDNNRKYFSGLSLTRNRRGTYVFHLARKVGKIWRCFCWEKSNFADTVKLETFDHLHLAYHFTVPLNANILFANISCNYLVLHVNILFLLNFFGTDGIFEKLFYFRYNR